MRWDNLDEKILIAIESGATLHKDIVDFVGHKSVDRRLRWLINYGFVHSNEDSYEIAGVAPPIAGFVTLPPI